MANVTIELNLQGLNELMKSPEIREALENAADAVVHEAVSSSGRDYKRKPTKELNWIAVSGVKPADKHAYYSNRKHNTLLKAVGAVGLPMKKGGT